MQYEVYDILKTLKQGKASGPDGINNRVLTGAAFHWPLFFVVYLISH